MNIMCHLYIGDQLRDGEALGLGTNRVRQVQAKEVVQVSVGLNAMQNLLKKEGTFHGRESSHLDTLFRV